MCLNYFSPIFSPKGMDKDLPLALQTDLLKFGRKTLKENGNKFTLRPISKVRFAK